MAYTKANNSAIVFAFRQLGLPLGFLAGVFFLHENAAEALGIEQAVGFYVGLYDFNAVFGKNKRVSQMKVRQSHDQLLR